MSIVPGMTIEIESLVYDTCMIMKEANRHYHCANHGTQWVDFTKKPVTTKCPVAELNEKKGVL